MAAEEHVLDLLPAYALDSLDAEDELWVGEHLATCANCRAELKAYQAIVDELPLAMVESEPPAHLKADILARAKQGRARVGEVDKPTISERISLFFRINAPAWGMVSLALILVLAASNLFLWGRLSQLESATQTALLTVALQGTDVSPGATATLVISLDGEHGTLVVDGLAELDESQQYQLWLIEGEQRTNGGVFSVSEEGYGNLWVSSPRPLLSYDAVGITIEPAGGSPGPTGERVLGGQL